LIITSAYVIAGFLTGISGILFAFYTNNVTPSTHGNTYELYGIAAAVLGGCSLRGGEGSILGIIIGTTLLLVLENLVNLLHIDSSLNFAVMGTVVLIGVLADQFFKNRSAKKISAK
jgi:ribose transport system permease protein